MKIRNRRLVAAAGWLASRTAQLVVRSLRVHYQPLGTPSLPLQTAPGRILLCMWHENLILPTVEYGYPEVAVLISNHADGKILGALIESMGMGMVCGSTNRGGVEAVRKLIRPDAPWRHLAVTPDGPRGPRRVFQPGAVYVASRTGLRIAPLGIAFARAFRAKSWDRFAVPMPFSNAYCVTSEPIAVPDKLKADGLETYRLRVQAEMDRLSALAEEWAATGKRPRVPAETNRAA